MEPCPYPGSTTAELAPLLHNTSLSCCEDHSVLIVSYVCMVVTTFRELAPGILQAPSGVQTVPDFTTRGVPVSHLHILVPRTLLVY